MDKSDEEHCFDFLIAANKHLWKAESLHHELNTYLETCERFKVRNDKPVETLELMGLIEIKYIGERSYYAKTAELSRASQMDWKEWYQQYKNTAYDRGLKEQREKRLLRNREQAARFWWLTLFLSILSFIISVILAILKILE